MKRVLAILALISAMAFSQVGDIQADCYISANAVAFNGEPIIVSNSAIAFTTATRTTASGFEATMAFVTVETNPIRIRMDGTNPTAAVGLGPIQPGQNFTVCGTANVRNLRMIRSGAADGAVFAHYYSER